MNIILDDCVNHTIQYTLLTQCTKKDNTVLNRP